jgi:hypothetical protein
MRMHLSIRVGGYEQSDIITQHLFPKSKLLILQRDAGQFEMDRIFFDPFQRNFESNITKER